MAVSPEMEKTIMSNNINNTAPFSNAFLKENRMAFNGGSSVRFAKGTDAADAGNDFSGYNKMVVDRSLDYDNGQAKGTKRPDLFIITDGSSYSANGGPEQDIFFVTTGFLSTTNEFKEGPAPYVQVAGESLKEKNDPDFLSLPGSREDWTANESRNATQYRHKETDAVVIASGVETTVFRDDQKTLEDPEAQGVANAATNAARKVTERIGA